MDVLVGDPAGGGILTFSQLNERDRCVFEATQDSATSVVWNFGGGYSDPGADGEDRVIRGHLNSLITALQIYESVNAYHHLIYEGPVP